MSSIEDQQVALAQETAKIAWSELQRFFAQGQVLQVADGLNLVAVAAEVAADDKAKVEARIASGDIAHVGDEQAKAWIENDSSVWSVVVAPWILVQNIKDKD